MILDDDQLHQAQSEVQTMWRVLEVARRAHSTLDYERVAAPYLREIQRRHHEIIEYLSTNSDERAFA